MHADDSAYTEGRGCYTSVRIEGGRPRFAERHVARLRRAARELGVGEVEAGAVRRALAELSEAAFGGGEGIVRLQASRDGAGRVHLVGLPRGLGRDRPEWSAVVVALPHEGSSGAGGLKVTSRLTLALAGDAADEAGADEALLVDGAGRLVEGARSNAVVVPPDGPPRTPPLASGAVAGVARQVALERVPELVEGEVARDELARAAEIVALNAVRGARPITRLDGRPVGPGRPGPWARRLAEALASD